MGTAIAEHMLDAVSDPGNLQQLLMQHSKERQHLGGSTAMVAAATADGLLPVLLSSAYVEGNSSGGGNRGGGSSTAPSSKLDAEAVGGSVAGDSMRAAGHALPQQQQSSANKSLSRELAVVFWRTLVDIYRNPALLLLHW